MGQYQKQQQMNGYLDDIGSRDKQI